MSPSPPPKPAPAVPLLASTLLALERNHRKWFAARGERIMTGVAAIDEYLLGREMLGDDGEDKGQGGFERGTVVGISSVEGLEGRLISLHLLASVLISNSALDAKPSNPATPTPKATIIDTTGSYPLALLAQVLESRFRQARQFSRTYHDPRTEQRLISANSGTEQKEFDQDDDEWAKNQTMSALERVAISRIFDVEGMWEVLGEMGKDAESQEAHVPESKDQSERAVHGVLPADGSSVLAKEAEVVKEILDSQEQDDEMLLEEFESKSNLDETESQNMSQEPNQARINKDEKGDVDGVEIIIVDTMTHLITELFSRKEKNEAHAHLALLTRTLHSLTRHNNILTILRNSTVPCTPSSSLHTNPNPHSHSQPPTENHYGYGYNTASPPRAYQKKNQHSYQQSLFPSNPHKPALGLLFAPIPDLHLFLSHLSRRKEDAELLYAGRENADDDLGNARQGEVEKVKKVEYCAVLEVLKDSLPAFRGDEEGQERKAKLGERERRWIPLAVTGDGIGLHLAFDEEQQDGWQGVGQRGRGRGREPETGRERGFVPRMYGFGGRRV